MKEIHRNLTIPDREREILRGIVGTFEKAGFECYLVGGSVRDLILGRAVYDFDFATDARPEQVMRIFRRVAPTGIKHGTVTILSGDRGFEVTTYRADGTYIDGRRPDSVFFSKSLEEDVLRRDFTINGLAYDVMKETVIDYVGGCEDIEASLIRTIGDPLARFGEDGLRPMRACRFAARLRFRIDETTLEAIGQTLDVARKVSAERYRDELMKLLDSEKPSVGFEYMRRSGLLGVVLPELQDAYGVGQNKFHMYDIYHHSIYSCDAASPTQPLIRLAALLHDIGKVATRKTGEDGDFTFYNHEVMGARITRRILKRLKFSNDEIEKVTNLVLHHMFHYTEEWSDGAVRRFMRKVELENLDDLFALRLADRRGNGARDGLPAPIGRLQSRIAKVIEDANAITVRDLEIDGYDVMNTFGLKPGPVIGRVLNELLELVLDDPAMNRHDILLEKAAEAVRRFAADGSAGSRSGGSEKDGPPPQGE